MFVTSDEKHNREERCDRQKSKKPPALRSNGFLTFCVCLSGGAKRRHLSMTSTRHGAILFILVS